METSVLRDELDEIVEETRIELYQKSSHWSKSRNPSEFFDFEQELQKTLNSLQAKVVGAILEEIHRDIDFVTECLEQSIRQCGARSQGKNETPVRTLSGKQTQIRTPRAWLPKKSDQKYKEKRRSQREGSIYPVLRRLGIIRGTTPRLLAELSRQMADGPSRAEVQERLANREIVISKKPIELRTYDFASIALWQRQQEIIHLDHVTLIEPSPLGGKSVVLSFDGGRIRTRINKQREDGATTKEYSTKKCESKVFAIYKLDQEGKKEKYSDVLYEGTILSVEFFSQLIRLRLQQLDISHAKLLVVLGDGAHWIWKLSEKLQTDLELQNIRVIEVVDLFHAIGKLTLLATVGISGHTQQRVWLKKTRRLLRDGHIDEVLDALQNLDQTNDHEQSIRKAIGYFTTHKKRMQYKQFRAEKLPLGSYVIESGIRRIINFRMKNTSTFWKPENAEAILYLRSQIKSQRWEDFVKSVLSQWASDMSISLPQALQIRQDIADEFLVSHPPAMIDSRREVIKWARNILDQVGAVILDTETTGLGEKDELIQLSIIDMDGNVLLHSFFNPSIDICPEAQKVHGLTKEQLQSAPTFSALYTKIASLLSHQHVIAYNAKFDKRLLRQTCQRYGFSEFEITKWECAMEKYAYFLGKRDEEGNYRSQSLTMACVQQGISSEGAHHATTDCLLTLKLITTMADAIE